LEYSRTRADIIEVYKLRHRLDKIATNILTTRSNTNTWGNTEKLFKPRARLKTRKYAFSHRVVDTWNSLPTSIIEAPVSSPGLTSIGQTNQNLDQNAITPISILVK
jgi:hypothetical protein